MAKLPVGGCVTYLRVTWDEDVIGLHLNEKDLKSGKERLSYGLFSKMRLGVCLERTSGLCLPLNRA